MQNLTQRYFCNEIYFNSFITYLSIYLHILLYELCIHFRKAQKLKFNVNLKKWNAWGALKVKSTDIKQGRIVRAFKIQQIQEFEILKKIRKADQINFTKIKLSPHT